MAQMNTKMQLDAVKSRSSIEDEALGFCHVT